MKKIIIANWKMSPDSTKEAKKIFSGIKKVASKLRNVQTVVCPPFIYLTELQKIVSGHRCVLGTQDSFWEKKGSFTGEISPTMISNLKSEYVILGHSERRALGETDEVVNKKIKACLKENLKIVLCIGEKERDNHGDYLSGIKEQIENSLAGISKSSLSKIIIAYEPLWAIGKNSQRPATPAESMEMSIFIKRVLADAFGKNNISKINILYGGSVDLKNAEVFLKEGGVNGLLVGRASLDDLKFGKILEKANF
jgi:triosephosphate isomerase